MMKMKMPMINAKEAIEIAKKSAMEMLEIPPISLEEIERGPYEQKDAWRITLSFPLSNQKRSPMAAFTGSNLQVEYKQFFIGADSGELLAMKMRQT